MYRSVRAPRPPHPPSIHIPKLPRMPGIMGNMKAIENRAIHAKEGGSGRYRGMVGPILAKLPKI